MLVLVGLPRLALLDVQGVELLQGFLLHDVSVSLDQSGGAVQLLEDASPRLRDQTARQIGVVAPLHLLSLGGDGRERRGVLSVALDLASDAPPHGLQESQLRVLSAQEGLVAGPALEVGGEAHGGGHLQGGAATR